MGVVPPVKYRTHSPKAPPNHTKAAFCPALAFFSAQLVLIGEYGWCVGIKKAEWEPFHTQQKNNIEQPSKIARRFFTGIFGWIFTAGHRGKGIRPDTDTISTDKKLSSAAFQCDFFLSSRQPLHKP